MPKRTLFLNPPSFEGFDGGAGSRWPSTREIESYWYPVWLAYPAGMIEGSKLLDGPPHGVTIEQCVEQAKDFELLVLFTSSPGFNVDVRIAEMMKDTNPKMEVAFVGPPVTIEPDKVLNASKAIDFIVRREFDYQIANYAKGTPLADLPGVSYRKDGVNVHNPEGAVIENLDELPWVTKVYKRDLDFTRYNVPFLLHPYVSFYTTRGCPAMCTFCLWPQTHSGHRWRLRSNEDIVNECRYTLENFPGLKEIFFDDDTFNYRKARTIELCKGLKTLKNFTWSCTSRVTTDYETLKAMKEAGCRLLIVGYESGDEQILRNIKKGATIDMARRFTENCHKLGLVIHGDFIVGLPGENRDTLRNTIDFAKRLDVETIQVSIAHAFPGTEFYDYAKKNNLVQINMADDEGHQLPNVVYPGILEREELVDWVERFYGEYYFRPKAAWRIVRKAIFDNHDRARLYKEAKAYLSLRHKRKKYVAEHKASRMAEERAQA
ncbi:MAG TPA: hopanoid biosynthesis associated radical SAM protein HpnJ [Bryobacteraceae bacterium]|nr:hopanoid biosynthesis associated radical SAM protein HpnJ [Bryobacteraceae bacterium]